MDMVVNGLPGVDDHMVDIYSQNKTQYKLIEDDIVSTSYVCTDQKQAPNVPNPRGMRIDNAGILITNLERIGTAGDSKAYIKLQAKRAVTRFDCKCRMQEGDPFHYIFGYPLPKL